MDIQFTPDQWRSIQQRLGQQQTAEYQNANTFLTQALQKVGSQGQSGNTPLTLSIPQQHEQTFQTVCGQLNYNWQQARTGQMAGAGAGSGSGQGSKGGEVRGGQEDAHPKGSQQQQQGGMGQAQQQPRDQQSRK